MRGILIGFFILWFPLVGCARDEDGKSPQQTVKIQELTDLHQLSQMAIEHNLPILLAFGAKWCAFCQQLREDVLNPMALSGDYEGKYMYMRYVSLDDDKLIPGVDGNPIQKDKWASGYGVDLTPTVLFIDGHGKEVANKIVGIANIELYSAMIHQALNQAYLKMNNPLRISTMPEGH